MIRFEAKRVGLTLILMLTAGALSAARGPASFTIVETGAGFARLSEAVEAIGEGEGTIRIAPGRYSQCAVQESGRIRYVAQERGTAIFDGVTCEGKAALVLRGRSAQVDGLVFTHQRVSDGNGAGIRIEQGDLRVDYTSFVDAQCGILSATDPSSGIAIDHSSFAGLGKHPDGNGAHSLYIGHYGSLRVTNSRFERGTGGHYVKSRSPRIEVTGTSFDDSRGHDTNYMIDLPNGATGRIAGNIFVNGIGKENYSAFITVGPEGRLNDSTGLVVEGNEASLVPGFRWPTTFVANWTQDRLTIRNNRLSGKIALVQSR
jgi:hypothetical protein